MPSRQPPDDYTGDPRLADLDAGTVLTRLHSDAYDVVEFNPTVSDSRYRGGRFDATSADPYSHLYAAADDASAVSEALLRDLPIDRHGAQLLPRRALIGRRISWLAPTRGLTLVSLVTGQDLAAVAQTTWLTQCGADEYPETRRWARSIRGWAPEAHGFQWRSRREPAGVAYVFFGDRCPPGSLKPITDNTPVPADDNPLDQGAGELYVRRILEGYRVTLFP